MAGKAPNVPLARNGKNHPFAKQDPKPTRARLVSLLDPLGRKRYAEIERFLATITGSTSGLHFYNNDWGWAVRYMLGTKDALCTLHLLPGTFEATVSLGRDLSDTSKDGELDSDLKRRISRTTAANGTKWVRLPIKSDMDFTNFMRLIEFKSTGLKAKGKAKKGSATASRNGKAEKPAAKAAAAPKAAAKTKKR